MGYNESTSNPPTLRYAAFFNKQILRLPKQSYIILITKCNELKYEIVGLNNQTDELRLAFVCVKGRVISTVGDGGK